MSPPRILVNKLPTEFSVGNLFRKIQCLGIASAKTDQAQEPTTGVFLFAPRPHFSFCYVFAIAGLKHLCF